MDMPGNQTRGERNGFFGILRGSRGRGDAWFVGIGLLLGLAGFAWAGFLGDPEGNHVFDKVPLLKDIPQIFYTESWLLFLWFCLAIVTVQASILLDRSLPQNEQAGERKAVATFIVTVACIIGVIAFRVYQDLKIQGRGDVVGRITFEIDQHPQLSLAVLNVGLMVIFWLLAITMHVFRRAYTSDPERTLGQGEQFIGDFTAAALFSLMLGVFFFVIHVFGLLEGGSRNIATWSDALCQWRHYADTKHCPPSGNLLLSLVFFNLAFFPIAFIAGALGVLLFTAFLAALRDTTASFTEEFIGTGSRVIKRFWTLTDLTIRLRYFWPLSALAAVVSAGLSASFILRYLNDINQSWHPHPTQAFGIIDLVVWLPPTVTIYKFALAALLAALAALVTTIASAALQVVPPTGGPASLLRNSTFMRVHVTRYVKLLVTSYWGFSLLLSLLNQIAVWVIQIIHVATGASVSDWLYAPFIQPDPLAVLSFAAFLFFSVRDRRGRGGDTQEPVPAGVAADSAQARR